MIEWGLLALAAATPPTLLVLGKTISSALSAPRPNSQPLGLKVSQILHHPYLPMLQQRPPVFCCMWHHI